MGGFMKNKSVLMSSCLLASTILLAACGSGSGGVTSTPSQSAAAATAAPGIATGGAIGGVAAKGLLSKAIVTAYCGNSELAADQLATGSTDAVGVYSLTWTTACSKPLKLVVTADANTTMADEATGTSVTPPAGFKLRALVADPDITTTKHITPFTDMAAVVAGTSATLSKTAASNAEAAIIKNVLGGDIGAYGATPLAPTAAAMTNASADEKKLATLLTVISAFAEDSTTAAACGKLTGVGAKVQCALEAFTKQAAATVTSVSDTGFTVATTLPTDTPASMLSTTLTKITTATITGTGTGTTSTLITATGAQALSTVVTTDTSGSAALLSTATSSVQTAATSAGGTVAVATATPLQAARDLFNSLKTDLLAISNGSGTGYLDQKISAMQTDWTTNANASGSAFTQSLLALTRAIELAQDARTLAFAAPAGTPLANAYYYFPSSSNAALETDSTGALQRYVRSFGDGMNCYVLVSEMTLGKAGCYYSNGQPNTLLATTFTGYFHAVEVVESTPGSGSYAWVDYMGSRSYTYLQLIMASSFYLINGNGKFRPAGAAVATGTKQTGTAVVTRNTAGSITAAKIKGNIQPLVAGQDYSTVDITGSSSKVSSTSEIASISGTVTTVKGTATTVTMSIGTGSQVVGTWTLDAVGNKTNNRPVSTKFNVQLKTAAFQYDGTMSADNFIKDLDPTGDYMPANGSFTGKISALSGGTATEFLSGTMGATLANVAAYNPAIATSATNFLKPTATFSGKVTNGGTTYDLTFIIDGSTYGLETATLNYSRTASQMVSVTITRTGASTANVTVKGSGDVNAVITNGVGDVNTGTTKVGSITKNPSQVSFTDGTYLLLGI